MNIPSPFIAEVTDYAGLVAALRARVNELGFCVSGCAPGSAAAVAGLGDGYLAKLLVPGTSQKRLGMLTLGPVLGVLGLKLFLVADYDQTERMTRRVEKRQAAYVRSNILHLEIPKAKFREMGSAGGKARSAKLTPAQRKRHAIKMSKARWDKKLSVAKHA